MEDSGSGQSQRGLSSDETKTILKSSSWEGDKDFKVLIRRG